MGGLRDQSAFETFDRMADRIQRMEAEAEASAELAEEYSGDVLKSKFDDLESTQGADEDLASLKREMGLAPPAPEPPAAVRVAPPPAVPAAAEPAVSLEQAEQDELAAALAELEAEEQGAQQKRMKR